MRSNNSRTSVINCKKNSKQVAFEKKDEKIELKEGYIACLVEIDETVKTINKHVMRAKHTNGLKMLIVKKNINSKF